MKFHFFFKTRRLEIKRAFVRELWHEVFHFQFDNLFPTLVEEDGVCWVCIIRCLLGVYNTLSKRLWLCLHLSMKYDRWNFHFQLDNLLRHLVEEDSLWVSIRQKVRMLVIGIDVYSGSEWCLSWMLQLRWTTLVACDGTGYLIAILASARNECRWVSRMTWGK